MRLREERTRSSPIRRRSEGNGRVELGLDRRAGRPDRRERADRPAPAVEGRAGAGRHGDGLLARHGARAGADGELRAGPPAPGSRSGSRPPTRARRPRPRRTARRAGPRWRARRARPRARGNCRRSRPSAPRSAGSSITTRWPIGWTPSSRARCWRRARARAKVAPPAGRVGVVDPDQEVDEGAGHDLRPGERARAFEPDLEDAVGMPDHLRERVGGPADRPELLDHEAVLEPDSLDADGRERGQPDLEPSPPDPRGLAEQVPVPLDRLDHAAGGPVVVPAEAGAGRREALVKDRDLVAVDGREDPPAGRARHGADRDEPGPVPSRGSRPGPATQPSASRRLTQSCTVDRGSPRRVAISAMVKEPLSSVTCRMRERSCRRRSSTRDIGLTRTRRSGPGSRSGRRSRPTRSRPIRRPCPSG